jgi:hypothetical protein
MMERPTKLALLLWASALAAMPVRAHEAAAPLSAPPPPPRSSAPAETNPVDQWLDEVRAQRQAWEARRRAAKEAIDARRRWLDPWGAAPKEAREKENQRRREALREQIEREREVMRNQPPWAAQPVPWQELTPTPEAPEPSTGAQADGIAPPTNTTPPPPPYPPLPGWNNRWYYRGY